MALPLEYIQVLYYKKVYSVKTIVFLQNYCLKREINNY